MNGSVRQRSRRRLAFFLRPWPDGSVRANFALDGSGPAIATSIGCGRPTSRPSSGGTSATTGNRSRATDPTCDVCGGRAILSNVCSYSGQQPGRNQGGETARTAQSSRPTRPRTLRWRLPSAVAITGPTRSSSPRRTQRAARHANGYFGCGVLRVLLRALGRLPRLRGAAGGDLPLSFGWDTHHTERGALTVLRARGPTDRRDATEARAHAGECLKLLPTASRSLFETDKHYPVTYSDELQGLLARAQDENDLLRR